MFRSIKDVRISNQITIDYVKSAIADGDYSPLTTAQLEIIQRFLESIGESLDNLNTDFRRT